MWVPIALSRDIPAGVTRAIILDGYELVAWRGDGGAVQVWEDRCPHRGTRLSYGFVRGDRLNCLYHGWEYGTGASCHRIPAHPDLAVPATIRAKAYAATESGGMVLVELSAPGVPPVLLAGLPVATLAVSAGIDTVFAHLEPRPLLDVQAFETTLEGVALTIGWHAPQPGRVMLHVVARDVGVESKALIALHRLRAACEGKAS
jgi:phenylpropionate dioxygenase-like ring-hydroxylating dioxygenase large terminal subunit